jgi:hypothetical protein
MKILKNKSQYILIILSGVLIGAALYTIGYARTKYGKQNSFQQKELVTSAPEVVSCVKNIKVVNREIKNPGSPDAIIAVEVENTSDLGITAISIESIKGRESYGTLLSTFDADEPVDVIKPHTTATLTIESSNIFPHIPLQIGSVTYADGSEEGCNLSLKRLHELKAKHESEKAKRKGASQ